MGPRPRRRTVVGASAVLSVALLSWRPVNHDDTFMYLATGEWVANHLAIPRVDPFSWNYHGHAWQTAGWGWGLILWAAQSLGGLAGIAALKPLLVCGVAAALLVCTRHLGSRPVPAWIFTVGALLAMSPWMTLRGQMASYVLFPVSIYFALRASDGERPHLGWLAGLVAVQVTWVNIHSAALASIPYLGAVLGGRALDRLLRQRHRSASTIVRAFWPNLLIGLCAVAALAVNPWGVGKFTHATAVRDLSRGTISEWAPLIEAGRIAVVPVIVALAAAIGFAVGKARIRVALVLPCVVGLVLTVDAIRNAPFFIMAVALFLPPVLPQIGSSLSRRRDLAYLGAGAFLLVALTVSVPQITKTSRPGPNIAVAATAALPPHCKLRNPYDMGGYVMATRPDVPVSSDGRNDMYGLVGFAQNSWFSQSAAPAKAGVEQITREHTTCVLARNGSKIVPLLIDAGWHVSGRDSGGVSLVRPASG